jgi:hypothetical protein
MKRVGLLLILMLTAACDLQSPGPAPSFVPQSVAQPSPSPAPQPPQPSSPMVVSVREVTVGESIEGVYGDGRTTNPGEHHFVLTAPQSGTANITLRWDPWWAGTLLKLTVDGQAFVGAAPNWSPVAARIRVEAGKRYLVVVSLHGADWLPEDPFVLSTVLEP